ncbi:hypothetical protein RKE29_05960 [Streptomyces sp. B1866]|uniref:hypothetical protein n=1 Tax=Streptomyces sp. B1866 TaxID=3075431 RepID=UPI002891E5BC|nr:hypothetical protein [Streptomyces sp. B1866]MDT3396185.1 hypothetical protein [Streptomyces sp. B1866]
MSNTEAVTTWCGRYVRPWWEAEEVSAEAVCAAPVVVAEVHPARYEDLAAAVTAAAHTRLTYARAETLLHRDAATGVILAVSPRERLAYRSEPRSGHLTIYGGADGPVATAAARLAREAVRGVLLRAGWSVLHASAAALGGRVVLTLGPKGAGKTTAALAMATRRGWSLLANDRVFVRLGDDAVEVLPWPSAAALGLGLLDAFGWYDVVRERLEAGEELHPTQDPRVTEALLAGRREPLWDDEGKRELKAQVFPDQFPDWFGVDLATHGNAAGLLFPRIDPHAPPTLTHNSRSLTDHDFMSGKTEDRYPDVFGLAGGVDGGGRAASRLAVAAALEQLPRYSVTLGHDLTANGDFLVKLAV